MSKSVINMFHRCPQSYPNLVIPTHKYHQQATHRNTTPQPLPEVFICLSNLPKWKKSKWKLAVTILLTTWTNEDKCTQKLGWTRCLLLIVFTSSAHKPVGPSCHLTVSTVKSLGFSNSCKATMWPKPHLSQWPAASSWGCPSIFGRW